MEREENNMFKFATKELTQDGFLCYLVNNCNIKTENQKVGKKFIELLANKIGDNKFKKYIVENDYNVEIKHQYKGIDVLLRIGDFYIIIEDKIDTTEQDNQINKYIYMLLNGGITKTEEFKIFTCYYKIYDEFKVEEKDVNCIITRKDMIQFLKKIENKNLYMEDYFRYLKEIEKYSTLRNIKAQDIYNLKSDILNKIGTAIYTSFYKDIEKKEKDIVGWDYADNRAGGTWWYASKKFKNVNNKDFDGLYAEINLKDDRNEIVIKLAKKKFQLDLSADEKLEDNLKDSEYYEKGKIKYFDKSSYYKKNKEKRTKYTCYKNLEYKVDIFDKVITENFLNELAKFDIYLNNNKTKGKIKKDNNSIYKYYTRIASIKVNEYTLEEIEDILTVINKHLEKLKIKF